ncbi:YihY family inner membrane protein [Roseovarius tibetensis]|uniref:YihY family inner membrane protein n=1 Tax=Roseovarius tibetensis TaxID=2685897 RepID=UPI003D7FE514
MKMTSNLMATLRQSRFGPTLADTGQFVVFAVRRFFTERLTAAAASLTYSTLLAIVPLMVIAFAILSSFPAFDTVKGQMQELFLSAVVPEAGAAIEDYLENFTRNASNLTAVGIVALAATAVLLLSTIEGTLNQIWHVERPRPIFVRFLIFWAILTLGPLLIGGSITLTTDLTRLPASTEYLGLGETSYGRDLHETWLVGTLFSTLVSTGISIVGFTALFVLVPARRVRIWHAATGATFAAIAFELLSWGFNSFLTSGSSYETIYGALAAVPVFLIWIYTSWMVIILGAVVAASIPDWLLTRTAVATADLRPSDRLAIAVTLLAKLHCQAQSGGMLDEQELIEAVPLEARDEIFDALHRTGYLAQTEESRVALVRDMHTTTVFDLAADLKLPLGVMPDRQSGLPVEIVERLDSETATVRRMLAQLHDAETDILGLPLASILSPTDDEMIRSGVQQASRRAMP